MVDSQVVAGAALVPQSKQRRYQVAHVATGLCQNCNVPRVTALHCEVHRQAHNRRRREAGGDRKEGVVQHGDGG